jgi:hypothetical protein
MAFELIPKLRYGPAKPATDNFTKFDKKLVGLYVRSVHRTPELEL